MKPGYVYILTNLHYCKIGYTTDLPLRLKQHEFTSYKNYGRLQFAGAMQASPEDEIRVQQLIGGVGIDGTRDWFHVTTELLDKIRLMPLLSISEIRAELGEPVFFDAVAMGKRRAAGKDMAAIGRLGGLAARGKTGRKKQPHCACGQMTLARAAKRNHKCLASGKS